MPKTNKCMRCGKKLTNPRSVSLGVGPECEDWRNQFIAGCGSSDEELAAIESHQDKTINRWANNFYVEMARKNTRRAKECLTAARNAISRQEDTYV